MNATSVAVVSLSACKPAAVQATRPDHPLVLPLLDALDAYLRQQYPVAEFGVDLTHILPVHELQRPGVSFLAAWLHDTPVGCGALRRMEDPSGAYGEVKRMFVHPDMRGQRIGQTILESLEEVGRAEGLGLMRLEGGTRQPEALRLYERCGYQRCERFGEYGPSPVSVFMEKRL